MPSHVELNLVLFPSCRCPLYSGQCDASVTVNCVRTGHALASVSLTFHFARRVSTRLLLRATLSGMGCNEASNRDSSRHHERY